MVELADSSKKKVPKGYVKTKTLYLWPIDRARLDWIQEHRAREAIAKGKAVPAHMEVIRSLIREDAEARGADPAEIQKAVEKMLGRVQDSRVN